MVTVIKQDDPILSVVAFQRVRALGANIKAQNLANQAAKMKLEHLGQSLQQNARIETANVELAESRAIEAGLTADLRIETQPGAVTATKVGQAAEIGEKVSNKAGGLLDAEDLSRVAAGINSKAKPGSMDHGLLMGALKTAQEKARQDLTQDTLQNFQQEARVAEFISKNPMAMQVAEENLEGGERNRIVRMARGAQERDTARQTKLQQDFINREAKEAQRILAEDAELGREERSKATIADPPTGIFGGVKEEKVEAAKRVVGSVERARKTLERLGLRDKTPVDDTNESLIDQPTAPPATPQRPAQTGRNSPTARATKFINKLDFGPNVTSAADIPDKDIANILGRLEADKGIKIKKVVLERLITRRIKAQRTREGAIEQGLRLQANPPPAPLATRNTPRG